MQVTLLYSLWELTSQARWFSGHSRGGRPRDLIIGDWVVEPATGPGIRPVQLTVVYPDETLERYFIPLVFRPKGQERAPELYAMRVGDVWYSVGELSDDDEAAGMLPDLLADSAAGFSPAREIPRGLAARRYRGEQSNTTIFFGTTLLAKIFRRLEPGRNPDVELNEALAGTGAVPEFYGSWRSGDTDLAIFQEALPEPQDGYVMACGYAERGEDFTGRASELGAALAIVHDALAERLPTDAQDAAELVEGYRRNFEQAAAEIDELERFRPLTEKVFGAVDAGTVPTQRIHGDCHLGQVLATPDGWRYVDFEGEPLKSIEERRRPDTPWRDVAGMLRSLGYAAASTQEDRSAWLTAARAAFLDGYGSADRPGRSLLAALELDKAIYEVVYETRNRPAWRRVPLDFLTTLARES